MSQPAIARPIELEDVDTLSVMAEEFEQYLNGLAEGRRNCSRMTREVFLRDGFGEFRAFNGVILERDSKALGYVLYCISYNTDLATRIVQVIDIFVRGDEQRKGSGRFLMRALIPICRASGAEAICVSVWKTNTSAQNFYKRLGAKPADEEALWWQSDRW